MLLPYPIIWLIFLNALCFEVEIVHKPKGGFFMSKKWLKVGIGLGLVAIGAVYLGKKTGLLEDDRHLYDEFESI